MKSKLLKLLFIFILLIICKYPVYADENLFEINLYDKKGTNDFSSQEAYVFEYLVNHPNHVLYKDSYNNDFYYNYNQSLTQNSYSGGTQLMTIHGDSNEDNNIEVSTINKNFIYYFTDTDNSLRINNYEFLNNYSGIKINTVIHNYTKPNNSIKKGIKFGGASQYYADISFSDVIVPNKQYLYETRNSYESAIINYYDDNGNLIDTKTQNNDIDQTHGYVNGGQMNNRRSSMFYVNNDYSDIWYLKERIVTTNKTQIFNLVPYYVEKDTTVFLLTEIGGGYTEDYSPFLAKDDDLGLVFIPLNYSRQGIIYKDYSFYLNNGGLKNNFFRFGYNIQTDEKIDDKANTYYVSAGFSSGGGGMFVLEYTKPVFSTKCEKEVLTNGDSTTCSLNVDTTVNINKMKINMSSLNIDMNKIIQNDKYEYIIQDKEITIYEKEYKESLDDYLQNCFDDTTCNEENFSYNYNIDSYLLENGDNENIELFKFEITVDENVSAEEIVKKLDVDFQLFSLSDSSDVDVSYTIKPLANPKTLDKSLVIVIELCILVISCMFIFIIVLNRKKQVKEL